MKAFGGQSMVAPLRRVIVKSPKEAFVDDASIDAQWRPLAYLRRPDLSRSIQDHQAFVAVLSSAGAEVLLLPQDQRTGMDSVYVHDPALICDAGAIVFQTGKQARRGEGPAFSDALAHWNIPIFASIDGLATAEGGDTLWLDSKTLLVGRGFRTNPAGVAALQQTLAPLGVTVVAFPLSYWHGADEVLHLQSFISLLDSRLALVYRPLLPVPLFELLVERGFQFVDVPDVEYESMGCNVLALAPRQVVMITGNPITKLRIEATGCRVSEFDGSEICLPGAGGPTCLTRPLLRG